MQFIKEKLKEARKDKKMTIADLHYALAYEGKRVSWQTISLWEKGVRVPKVDDIADVARVCNKSVGYFFANELPLNSARQR